MYLIDTNIIIDALKARRSRLDFLQQLSRSQPLGFCSVVVAELFAGFGTPQDVLRARADLLDSILYVPTSERAAELAGSLQHRYKKTGVSLALTDVLIAAVAITEDHVLVSENAKHFPMPELKLLTPPRHQ